MAEDPHQAPGKAQETLQRKPYERKEEAVVQEYKGKKRRRKRRKQREVEAVAVSEVLQTLKRQERNLNLERAEAIWKP